VPTAGRCSHTTTPHPRCQALAPRVFRARPWTLVSVPPTTPMERRKEGKENLVSCIIPPRGREKRYSLFFSLSPSTNPQGKYRTSLVGFVEGRGGKVKSPKPVTITPNPREGMIRKGTLRPGDRTPKSVTITPNPREGMTHRRMSHPPSPPTPSIEHLFGPQVCPKCHPRATWDDTPRSRIPCPARLAPARASRGARGRDLGTRSL
jgi:hypothetical protein